MSSHSFQIDHNGKTYCIKCGIRAEMLGYPDFINCFGEHRFLKSTLRCNKCNADIFMVGNDIESSNNSESIAGVICPADRSFCRIMSEEEAVVHLVWAIAVCDGDLERMYTEEEESFLSEVISQLDVIADKEVLAIQRKGLHTIDNIVLISARHLIGSSKEMKLKTLSFMTSMGSISSEDGSNNKLSFKEDEIFRKVQIIFDISTPELLEFTSVHSEVEEVDRNSDTDPLLKEAAELIVESQQGSTSLIQRKFSIGYNRAVRIIDQLEKIGIVGPYSGSSPREVLVGSLVNLNSVFGTGNESATSQSERDELFAKAALLVFREQHASASILQRNFLIGYNRAGGILDQLESANIIGPKIDGEEREILVKKQIDLLRMLV